MSVLFHSCESDTNIEVGEYKEFPKMKLGEPSSERTPKLKLRHVSVVLLSFGLLCVLQGILNISLRLTLSEPTNEGETEEESCPRGWVVFGSSCYYISSQARNWDDSRRDCLQRDADLVIIDSRQEQVFLTGLTVVAWVGMTDKEEERNWIWVDRTPVNKDWLKWAPGQPDEAFGGEDCGDLRNMVNFTGLNDFNCGARNQWICEKIL